MLLLSLRPDAQHGGLHNLMEGFILNVAQMQSKDSTCVSAQGGDSVASIGGRIQEGRGSNHSKQLLVQLGESGLGDGLVAMKQDACRAQADGRGRKRKEEINNNDIRIDTYE